MEVRLKVTAGKHAGQEVRIGVPKFFVGRAEDCQLRPKSDLISRHHCVLLVDDEAAAIRDLGSRNGTYVNDERVNGERTLITGDRLKIGPLEFEVRIIDAAKKRPKVNSIREAATRTAQSAAQSDLDVTQWIADEGEGAGVETRELGPASPTVESSPAEKTAPAAETAPVADAAPIVGASPVAETAPVVGAAPVAGAAVASSSPAAMSPAQSRSSMAETMVGQPASLHDTQTPEGDTEEFHAGATLISPAVDAPQVDPHEQQPPKPHAANKLPKVAKPSTADSREAAADVLRKFFQRR